MNEMIPNEVMQQLVDGELSQAERRRVLMQMDEDPNQWRRLALAFVEAQIWDESISSVTSPADDERAVDRKAKVDSPTRKSHRLSLSRVLTLALLLLVALGIGFGAGSFFPIATDRTTVITETDPKEDHTPDNEPTALRFEEAIARSATPVPDSFRQRLLQSGYLLDEDHTLTSVTLPTGERVEIPVRNVSVQYLGNAAYQ